MLNITVYRSASANGPLSRQSFRLTSDGAGCYAAVHADPQEVIACWPALIASTMLM
jgi:hypothetical protein